MKSRFFCIGPTAVTLLMNAAARCLKYHGREAHSSSSIHLTCASGSKRWQNGAKNILSAVTYDKTQPLHQGICLFYLHHTLFITCKLWEKFESKLGFLIITKSWFHNFKKKKIQPWLNNYKTISCNYEIRCLFFVIHFHTIVHNKVIKTAMSNNCISTLDRTTLQTMTFGLSLILLSHIYYVISTKIQWRTPKSSST